MSCAIQDSSQCSTPDSGATTASAMARPRIGLVVLQRQHDQRRQHADADEGDDAQHAQGEGGGELALPRQDHLHQRGDDLVPGQALGLDDAFGHGLHRAARRVGDGLGARPARRSGRRRRRRAARAPARPSGWHRRRRRAISASWRPCSATLPPSSTRMRSQSITLDRRWARISVVRPCISRSSASWITASFSASTADSASSSTRIGVSRSSARAMATRWRWPPESLMPFSPIVV